MNNKKTFDLALAIDFCDSAFVFIDNHFRIQYVNRKALNLFQEHEDLFKYVMPNFDLQNMNGLHFSYVQDLLVDEMEDDFLDLELGQTLIVHSTLENLTLKFKFTVMIKDLERVGTCIELVNVSPLVRVKREFDLAMESANEGDFSYRINTHSSALDNYYFEDVFRKVNQLFETLNLFVHDISLALENLSQGNLTHCYHDFKLMSKTRLAQICDNCDFYNTCYRHQQQTDDKNYYNLIKKDFNYTFEKLWSFIADIKANQNELEEAITDIILSYSDISIKTEAEYERSQTLQDSVKKRTEKLKQINKELNQTTHIREITNTNNEAIQSLSQSIDNLKELFTNVDEQIYQVGHITKTLDLMFAYHVEKLQDGLKEVNQGNIGKGIHLISDQANEIIHKTKESMLQVHDSIRSMRDSHFSTHQQMNQMIISVLSNTQDMNLKIDLLNHGMTEIERSVRIQEEISLEITNFVRELQVYHINLVDEMEDMILSSGDLVRVNEFLKKSLKAFKLDMDDQDFI